MGMKPLFADNPHDRVNYDAGAKLVQQVEAILGIESTPPAVLRERLRALKKQQAFYLNRQAEMLLMTAKNIVWTLGLGQAAEELSEASQDHAEAEPRFDMPIQPSELPREPNLATLDESTVAAHGLAD